MEFCKSLFLPAILACSTVSFSQIVTRQPQQPPVPATEEVRDSVRPKRIPTDGTDEFTFYLGASYVKADRLLAGNDNLLFSQALGERANETSLNTWSYQLGLRNQITRWFAYDAAVSLERNGESYSFRASDSDSSYSYKTHYNYVGIPIQFYATYGKDLRFFLGGGIQPELYIGYRQDIRYTTADNKENSSKVTKFDKAESFLLGVMASAGVQYRLGRLSSIYLIPGMLWNLNSSYNDQSPYSHKARNFTLKFGLAFHFPN